MRFNFYKSNGKKPIGNRFLAVGLVLTTGAGLVTSTPFLAKKGVDVTKPAPVVKTRPTAKNRLPIGFFPLLL